MVGQRRRAPAPAGRRGVRAGAGGPAAVHLAGTERLAACLEAQGGRRADGEPTAGLHPYVVPLAAAGDAVTGVLRWPRPAEHPDLVLPVVRMDRGGRTVHFLARSPEEYCRRALAEEDLAGGAELFGALEGAGELYTPGDAPGTSLPHASAYLTRHVGIFPDVVEDLIRRHRDKGDETSAMVTAEWYAKNHYQGTGHPLATAAGLFTELGRAAEARDFHVLALRRPWWTLGDLRAAVDGAGFGDEPLGRIKEKLEEVQPKKLVIGGVEMDPETPEDALLKKARDKLDEVCAGDGADWDGAREYLAFLFRDAGLADFADFVAAP